MLGLRYLAKKLPGTIVPTDAAKFHDNRPARGRTLAGAIVLAAACCVLQATARAGDTPAKPASFDDATVLSLEAPHPDILIDRLTDPRIQQTLNLLPQYRKFREGPQFRQLQAVANLVAGQLGTTWDRGLRDITGGGIAARVAIEAGKPPVFELVITPRDAKLLERALGVFINMARGDARDKKTRDPVRTVDYHGKPMYLLGARETPDLTYSLIGGRLALANSQAGLERLIDRLEKPGASAAPTVDTEAPVVLRGHVDLARLRKLDPKKFGFTDRPNAGIVFLFGAWYEALKQAPAVDATIRWSGTELSADLDLPLTGTTRPATLKGFLPGPGEGAPQPLRPPGTIACLTLWRDWATIWEARADLFSPETVQGFAQLDSLAGQFFGGREFGADVLAAFEPRWRLVIAQQDFASMKPAPDTKLPGFAIVAELNGSREDFAERLKVAFQAIIGIANVDPAQKGAFAYELRSEDVDGVTMTTTKPVLARKSASPDEPGASRYNYSPSIAHVGRYFILSSSAGLARSLIRELKADAAAGKEIEKPQPHTFAVAADGAELARLLELNRDRMIMQSMLSRGETKEDAARRVDMNLSLLRYLGRGGLAVQDTPDRTHLHLKFDLSR